MPKFVITDLPLGLPEGSVRAIIALTFTALVAYSFVSTGSASAELMTLAGPYLGYYFASRAAAGQAAPAEEPLPEPSVPEANA